MTCCTASNVLVHYTGESKTYYCNCEAMIRGRTITGVTSIASSDSSMTVGALTILSAATDDYDQWGNAVTIPANQGVSFTMAGGSVGDVWDEYTATVTILFTTSAGTEEARIRVKVL